MSFLRMVLSVGLGIAGMTSLALAVQTDPPKPASQPADEQLSPQELNQKVMTIAKELDALFKAKKYPEIIARSDQLIALLPQKPDGYYSKASALARLGKKVEALKALETCVQKGFADAPFMEKDEDLASLRDDPKYKELVAQTQANDLKNEEGTYEKGDDLPGVRTEEAKPSGGLRYRLRMSPAATADKPNKLIVWFHPSGGSMNKNVERMAPELNKRGYALLVFTQKNFSAWAPEEMQKAAVTMTKVGEVKGLDPRKPILFGFSAGGQAAIMMWQQNAAKLGGMVLDAAYPVVMQAKDKAALLAPPAGELAKGVPFFVLVGEKDGGAQVWKAAEKVWTERGVPLTVHYIPGKAHGWLFDQEQTEAFYKWLDNPTAAAASQPMDAANTQPVK